MWTTENTEGFTQADLDEINAARERLAARYDGVDEKNLDDLVNNAWNDGMTADEIVAAVSALLG